MLSISFCHFDDPQMKCHRLKKFRKITANMLTKMRGHYYL